MKKEAEHTLEYIINHIAAIAGIATIMLLFAFIIGLCGIDYTGVFNFWSVKWYHYRLYQIVSDYPIMDSYEGIAWAFLFIGPILKISAFITAWLMMGILFAIAWRQRSIIAAITDVLGCILIWVILSPGVTMVERYFYITYIYPTTLDHNLCVYSLSLTGSWKLDNRVVCNWDEWNTYHTTVKNQIKRYAPQKEIWIPPWGPVKDTYVVHSDTRMFYGSTRKGLTYREYYMRHPVADNVKTIKYRYGLIYHPLHR